MNKAGLSILSLIVGFVAGLLAGFAIHASRESAPPVPGVKYFYYRLNDSLVSRHGVSGSDGRVEHTIDTIRVEPR
jgi:hypothetical protein